MWPLVAIFAGASPRCIFFLLVCVLVCVPMPREKRQRCFFCNSHHRDGQEFVAVTKGVDDKFVLALGVLATTGTCGVAVVSRHQVKCQCSMVHLSCFTQSCNNKWQKAAASIPQHSQENNQGWICCIWASQLQAGVHSLLLISLIVRGSHCTAAALWSQA